MYLNITVFWRGIVIILRLCFRNIVSNTPPSILLVPTLLLGTQENSKPTVKCLRGRDFIRNRSNIVQ